MLSNAPASAYANCNLWGGTQTKLDPNSSYHLEGYVLSSSDIVGSGVKLTLQYTNLTDTGWAVKNSATWQKISADFTTGATTPPTIYLRLWANVTAGSAWLDSLQLIKTGVVALALPGAPANLASTAATGTAIALAWTDNSTNENGFKVERSADGSTGWAQIAMLPVGANSFVDSSLTPSTSYFYRVYAYNLTGSSSYSSAVQATTAALTLPTAPSGLSAITDSQTAISLTWVDNSLNESGFKVERSESASGPWTSVTTTAAGATSYTDSALVAGTTYFYRVAATRSGIDSTFSATASAATDANTDTTAPIVSSAAATSATQVLVTFSEEITAATANLAGNYAVPGLAVSAAVRQADPSTVLLTVTGLDSATYTLTVTGVRDVPGNPIGTSNQATFTYSAAPTNGMLLWLRADAGVTQTGNKTSAWTSQGGNATTANQTVAGSQPAYVANALNGKPVIRFDGVDDCLNFAGVPVNGLTGMTIFMVAANRSAQAPSTHADASAIFWTESGGSWGTVYLSPYQASVRYRFGTTQNQSAAYPTCTRSTSNGGLIGGNFSISSVTHNGTSESLFVNGVAAFNQTGKLATIAACGSNGYLGRGNASTANSTQYFYDGDIAEVIVYNRAVSDTERQTVEAYLNNKYFYAAPDITAQPTDAAVAVGGNATFSVSATGTPAPTYQWRKDGANLSGATNATLTIASAQAGSAGSYTVLVSNSAGNILSNPASLTVESPPANIAPSITLQPISASVAVGAAVSFSVNATGTPAPTYQWLKNGSAISGATNATFTIASVQLADAGNYAAFVSNAAGNATSSVANLGVSVPDPFDTWAAARNLSGSSALALADPDGDGRPNLVEYALGSNPGASDAPTLTMDCQAGHLTMAFSADAAKSDITYTVQASDDLVVWTDIAQSAGGAMFSSIGALSTIDDSGSGLRNVTVTDASAMAARRFLRLKVTK